MPREAFDVKGLRYLEQGRLIVLRVQGDEIDSILGPNLQVGA